MIEFDDVYLQYGSRKILDGISMVIPDGQITAILGPSGSGKSTILKLMLGLIKPTFGRVMVDGTDITHFSEEQLFPIRKRMGIVFQGNALFDSMSVSENMGFFLRENLHLPETEITRMVREQLHFAGLEGHEHQLPDSLSGGMRKRVAIGRALIFGPKMVLFDEPTSGLDPVSTKQILDVIKSLKREMGLGAVMVTHIINDVFNGADIVLILFHGKLIFNDTPETMEHSDHPFVRSFLEHPEEL
jgi:phospholipid/cholesterol/gamma-HCH transport system ATP-binding protein